MSNRLFITRQLALTLAAQLARMNLLMPNKQSFNLVQFGYFPKILLNRCFPSWIDQK